LIDSWADLSIHRIDVAILFTCRDPELPPAPRHLNLKGIIVGNWHEAPEVPTKPDLRSHIYSVELDPTK
jgi:hypothetical protein